MKLYEDVEPLRLAGYASVFGIDYVVDGGSWERIERDAFALSAARPAYLAVAHIPDRRYASARDRSLRFWQDHHGLAFEASIPWSAGALPLVEAIRRGELTGVSASFVRQEIEVVSASDRRVEAVRKAEVIEVSLCWAPACPCTAVWVADDPTEELPAHVAAAHAHWMVGKMRAELAAARRPAARARAAAAAGLARAAAVPESVLRVLARHGPRGLR